MQGTVRVNKVTQNKDYMRKILTQRKAISIINMPALVNVMDALDTIQLNASRFSYPFFMM